MPERRCVAQCINNNRCSSVRRQNTYVRFIPLWYAAVRGRPARRRARRGAGISFFFCSRLCYLLPSEVIIIRWAVSSFRHTLVLQSSH